MALLLADFVESMLGECYDIGFKSGRLGRI